jgi:hypothetical protein
MGVLLASTVLFLHVQLVIAMDCISVHHLSDVPFSFGDKYKVRSSRARTPAFRRLLVWVDEAVAPLSDLPVDMLCERVCDLYVPLVDIHRTFLLSASMRRCLVHLRYACCGTRNG